MLTQAGFMSLGEFGRFLQIPHSLAHVLVCNSKFEVEDREVVTFHASHLIGPEHPSAECPVCVLQCGIIQIL